MNSQARAPATLTHAREQLAELIDVLRDLNVERAAQYWRDHDVDLGHDPSLAGMHRVRLDPLLAGYFTPIELEQSRAWLVAAGYGPTLDVELPDDEEELEP